MLIHYQDHISQLKQPPFTLTAFCLFTIIKAAAIIAIARLHSSFMLQR
jgi:hypothetical protein